MQSKSKLILSLIIILLCSMTLAQTVSAYTYPRSYSERHIVWDLGHSGSLFAVIPYIFGLAGLIGCIVAIIAKIGGWKPRVIQTVGVIVLAEGVFFSMLGSTEIPIGKVACSGWCPTYLHDPRVLPLGIVLLIVGVIFVIVPVYHRKR